MPIKDLTKRREYYRTRYIAQREAYASRAKINRANQRARLRKLIKEAKEVPCADCGVEYPHYVMQFDHLGEKNFNVADYVRTAGSIKRLMAELELCDVVCANCHAERTYRRRWFPEDSNPAPADLRSARSAR